MHITHFSPIQDKKIANFNVADFVTRVKWIDGIINSIASTTSSIQIECTRQNGEHYKYDVIFLFANLLSISLFLCC